jgi:hypothetical protein
VNFVLNLKRRTLFTIPVNDAEGDAERRVKPRKQGKGTCLSWSKLHLLVIISTLYSSGIFILSLGILDHSLRYHFVYTSIS